MSARRRQRGFESPASLPADQLGLSAARGKELVLAAAWRGAAGEAIARNASAIAVRRGVLEIEVSDERWLETVKALLPRMALRLAQMRPELGVRKFRLRRAGRPGPEPPVALPSPAAQDRPEDEPNAPPELAPTERSPAGPEGREGRLERVRERYLERSARRSAPPRRSRRPA